MPEFLKLLSVADAKKTFFDELGQFIPESEEVDTLQSIGRVISKPILSNEFLPAFSRSSMDGYAVKAADTFGSSESLPAYLKIIGELPMGAVPELVIGHGQAALIHTGGMLPEGADAVVILELSHATPQAELEVYKPVSAGENIIFKGEDVKPGDEVLPAGRLIRPADVGGLLALGYTRCQVARKPLIAILSCGDEVIPPSQTPLTGQVRDINSGSLAALVEQNGGKAKLYPIIPDQREQMVNVVQQAFSEADAVLISAGSSASSRDITAEVIQGLGAPGVLVHGINFRPGKPTILAVCNGKPVIGLPGNPVSALVIGHFFVRPLIHRMLGMTVESIEPLVQAIVTINVSSQAGKEEWIPVKLKEKDGQFFADPFFFKSNLIFQLANANGLMRIEADETGKLANSQVDVLIY